MKNLKGNRIYVIGAAAIILVAVLGFLGYKQYTNMKAQSANPGQASQEEIKEVLDEVKKLMIVPEEQPVMAKIDNADELKKQQAFFAGATNGDVVLIFPQAVKAVIYSPSRHLIVNSGPIQTQNTPTGTATTPETTTDTKAAPKK
jgi:mRNA degradation ribonuclease J1/J2